MGRKIIRHACTAVVILCIAAAAVMGFRLIQKESQYKEDQEAMDSLYAVFESAGEPSRTEGSAENTGEEAVAESAKAEEVESEPRDRREAYAALHSQNSDMIGWITIRGTQVDYPVMHTPEEPEYYLRRNFEKKESSYGMIFLDGACRLDNTSPNLLIYGHHMKNGAMFAEIEKYDSRSFWESHRYVNFDTLTENGVYQVIAAFKQPAALLDEDFKKMLLAENPEDYQRLTDFLKTQRFYDTGLEASYPDQLITLTTCEYTQKDGRFFVVAKRLDNTSAATGSHGKAERE